MQVQWVGSPNHYQGRCGYSVTHITLHIMVGRLTGTDSVFAGQASQTSAHYGIGADGTIHQYVSESDGSWSDANEVSNCSTISIEHEGGMAGVPCTRACMDASAELCADIARRYGWPRLWHDGLDGNVWLHREVPGSDHAGCPDLAPNGLDVAYVIDKANQLLTGETPVRQEDDDMQAIIQINDEPGLRYFDGQRLHDLTHPDQVTALQMVAQACGRTLPCIKLGDSRSPWGTRLVEALR
ncbi:N-acetylmuramoyl-L-alanine amidase [Bifidobacterium bombi]|uniref:N-acetylmuramoyl-L-alanine amidase n=1 Tax=Bifidobacterium bombi DSM 19703 TaxID=1341695 RepID=A0A080N6H9_9BIFI|nr:N-acetylmuramoyl-L-alanine amidase [Bifidobacterium bombi]KFF31639.1 N-acetylmuramoyl-L-alanine amidase family protein [Bifidobacterium bombi DSM 19703]